jgi:putative ABC transport system ATP-binding protein
MHMGTSQVLDDSMIRLEDVSRRYRIGDDVTITALEHVSLRVPEGAAVAVSGPSGSGKSTLLHLIGALDRPDEGAVWVAGQNLGLLRERELTEHRRRVGFVFQRFNLLPALTALDNVTAPVLPLRTTYDKHERARELLAAVGLAGREHSMPSKLSGGEQQRVAIARALVNHPSVVLADEPTGNLDTQTGEAIMDLLLDLRERERISLLVATHDIAVASRCDRVIRIVDGRLRDDIDVRGAADPGRTLMRLSRTAPR